MRRGFLLSTPREPRRTAPPAAAAKPEVTAPPSSDAGCKASQSTTTPTKTVSIPTSRYCLPTVLSRYPSGFQPYLIRRTQVPETSCPELQTMFVSYNLMLEDIRALYPGWPLPFSTPSPPVHKVTPIDGAGLGLVATRDIAAGELIVRERPYILQPAAVLARGSPEDIYRMLEGFVESMHTDNKRGVYALANAKGSTVPSTYGGIMHTNSMQAGAFPGYPGEYTGIARDISRANHSCSPNAHHAFDMPTMTYSLRALRAIRAGEEITITYLDPLQPRHVRQQDMQDLYGFTCRCKICRLTGAERTKSDLARHALEERLAWIAQDDARFAKWVLGGAELLPRDQRKPDDMDVFTMDATSWALMESEEYCEPSLWEPLLARLVKGCSVLEDKQKVRFYATKAAELSMAFTGSDGGWRAVAENPRQTEWWAKLGAKRKR